MIYTMIEFSFFFTVICLQLLNSTNLDGTEHLSVGAGPHLGDSEMRRVPFWTVVPGLEV